MRNTYQITTLNDIVDAYLAVEPDRQEILLKEMADAVRLIAPMVAAAREMGGDFTFTPIRWIDDVKGTAKITVSSNDEVILDIKAKL